ncbi:MAG: AbgT family transporter, partial [Gemmatimonadales bacterium]
MTAPAPTATRLDRALATIERIGNKLPDPALLFVILLVIVWITSALLSSMSFSEIDPRNGQPISIINQLTGPALATFFSNMVTTFTGFHPLGVVLVALLGVGVAEYSGFINAGLKSILSVTTPKLLTPLVIFVATLSHTAADAGYVLVIPLGAVMFAAAGRHPVAGIAAAFAGVSGGFSANMLPSAIDPLLQGLTQSAAQMIDPSRLVNPLNNWYFLIVSTVLIVLAGWFVTDKIVEPRLRKVAVDGDGDAMPKLEPLSDTERRGLRASTTAMLAGLALLVWLTWPE